MKKRLLYIIDGFIVIFIFHIILSVLKRIQTSRQWLGLESMNFFSLYFKQQDYFLGTAYGLAGAFTIYAFTKFIENRKNGIAGVVSGITLTGILYFAGCFLLGCCGSPMLAVYLSLFGSSFLGFTKPFVLALTAISVVVGYLWIEKKTKTCCSAEKKNIPKRLTVSRIISELKKGISFAKCRKCGCMKEVLENLQLSQDFEKESKLIKKWQKEMEDIKYSCLGCKYCYAAVAMNIFNSTFHNSARTQFTNDELKNRELNWPMIAGEYFAFCKGEGCPVAVSTLGSINLAETLAQRRPKDLCIVGKTETENIGIEKIIINTITNPTIRILIVAGKDSEGHYSGRTLLSLWKNGVDKNMRVIDSPGVHPVLKNVTREEIEFFRKQIKMVDMIGCEEPDIILRKINELAREVTCLCSSVKYDTPSVSIIQKYEAEEPAKIMMDPLGYFVIIPDYEKNIITVEHYSYDNKLQHIIQGKDARSIYYTIIKNDLISQFYHAAYLGKELEKAELSIKMRFKYVQDSA